MYIYIYIGLTAAAFISTSIGPVSFALRTPAQALAVRFAPLMTISGELLLSLCFIVAAMGRCNGRICGTAARLGVFLALLLHLGIAVTPPPNNVGAFSVLMVSLTLTTHPDRCIYIYIYVYIYIHCNGRICGAAARLGVFLALLLHLGIALTPSPNNVGAFSVLMVSVYIYIYIHLYMYLDHLVCVCIYTHITLRRVFGAAATLRDRSHASAE